MVYVNSCEEHKYLAGIRREKESFERLIKERGVCFLQTFTSLQLIWQRIVVHASTHNGRATSWKWFRGRPHQNN